MVFLLSLVQIYAAPIVMAGISAAYFVADHSNTTLNHRILTSAHGAAAAILNVVALAIWIAGRSQLSYSVPYLWLHAVPVALIVVLLVAYRGPKWIHILQLPNLVAMFWGLFVGSMAITNDWL